MYIYPDLEMATHWKSDHWSQLDGVQAYWWIKDANFRIYNQQGLALGNVKARAAVYKRKTDILWFPEEQLFALKRLFSLFFSGFVSI